MIAVSRMDVLCRSVELVITFVDGEVDPALGEGGCFWIFQ